MEDRVAGPSTWSCPYGSVFRGHYHTLPTQRNPRSRSGVPFFTGSLDPTPIHGWLDGGGWAAEDKSVAAGAIQFFTTGDEMLTVEFSQAAADNHSLRVGVVIRYGDNGPVRFAQVVIDEEALDWGSLDALLTFASQATNRYLDRERELDPEPPLPGL